MRLLWPLARRFVAGESWEKALPRIKEQNSRGLSVTIDILGENVSGRDQSVQFVEAYIDVLRALSTEDIVGNISTKPTMMGLSIDDEFCYQNYRRILDEASRLDNFVRIDMEGSDYTQRTIDLFFRLREKYSNVGIVIQSYLFRSEEDIRGIVKRGATVRLCKGAYRESGEIAFKKMKDVRANFIKLSKTLLTEGHYPAIATHDTRIIEWTKEFIEKHGISRDAFEFQMLYGMRPGLQEDLAKDGYRMRVYVPFGSHWFPYFYRRLRERKENVWFVIKNLFKR